MTDESPREEFQFSMTTATKGRITLKLFDRINIDDIFVHLVHREVFRLLTGTDAGVDVPTIYKDYLLKERFTTGQG